MAMEYEPLFEPGFYDVPYTHFGEQLRPLLVDSFTTQEYRKKMWGRLCKLLLELNSISFITEVWLDGSFVCKKGEPKDIDMVVIFCNPGGYTTQEKLTFLQLKNKSEMLIRYGCDMYFVSKEDSGEQEYWKNWYGKTKPVDDLQMGIPKGIVRIFFR